MKLVLLYNPISGAGQSGAAARRLADRAIEGGHDVELVETRIDQDGRWLDDRLAGCGALVVVGGDGAVRTACRSASRTNTPVYQYPMGTENLLSREFGMDRSAETLMNAIDRYEVRRVDLGDADGRPFLSMVSIGYDAAVVADLAQTRVGAINHLNYLGPMVRQFLRWQPPQLEVLVDGEPIWNGASPGVENGSSGPRRRGWIIVANSRQYAFRLNPAPDADMSDGLLDVVYVGLRSRLGLLSRMVSYRRGRQIQDPAALRRRGRVVEVRVDPPQLMQLDGDPPDPILNGNQGGNGSGDGRIGSFRISLQEQALPVLVP